MRNWKSLLATNNLFTVPTIVENRLILTLTVEHDSARNLRSIVQQLQNVYKNSNDFQSTFTKPLEVGETIALELKAQHRRSSADKALEQLRYFVIPGLKPLSRDEIRANRRHEKRVTIKNALTAGTLFKAVQQTGNCVDLVLADEFNHNAHYADVRAVLQELHRNSPAFSAIFQSVSQSKRKPQLHLKQSARAFHGATLLRFVHNPNTTLLVAQPEITPAASSVVVHPEVTPAVSPVAARLEVALAASPSDQQSYDEFFDFLPDLIQNFSDTEFGLTSSSSPLLFKYGSPYYTHSSFDIESFLLEKENPIDVNLGSEFEESVNKVGITVTM